MTWYDFVLPDHHPCADMRPSLRAIVEEAITRALPETSFNALVRPCGTMTGHPRVLRKKERLGLKESIIQNALQSSGELSRVNGTHVPLTNNLKGEFAHVRTL